MCPLPLANDVQAEHLLQHLAVVGAVGECSSALLHLPWPDPHSLVCVLSPSELVVSAQSLAQMPPPSLLPRSRPNVGDSLIHQRADSRSKKNYNPEAYGTKTTFTER